MKREETKLPPFYERPSQLEQREYMKLSPGVRLSLGYYLAAKRRREQMSR